MLAIRLIQPEDDPEIGQLIRSVLVEFNVPKVGTAYADPSLDCMYETYQKERTRYFILTDGQSIYGGGGIAPLENYLDNYCELQKMYFDKRVRGKGYGRNMMDLCLSFASSMGYSHCYLETMEYMGQAQKLYQQSGFDYIDGPLGDTGHHACGIQMLKTLF
jgi:putative acetyltransferase